MEFKSKFAKTLNNNWNIIKVAFKTDIYLMKLKSLILIIICR